jgi:hypothetical protein
MVIINLDISNAFGTLCARLVLDHLSDKGSRDYPCGINTDTDFETGPHELKPISVFSDSSAHVKRSFVSTHTMDQQIMSGGEQVDYKEIVQSL